MERLLESPCRRQEYSAGRRMLNPGDPCRALMVLVEGQAEARMMGEEGREVLVDHLKAPMLLAPAFLFANNNVVPVEVTALTDCVVWHINREAFFEFMQQESTVLRSFLEVLSERGRFLSRKMRTFAVNSLRNRVIERCAPSPSTAFATASSNTSKPTAASLPWPPLPNNLAQQDPHSAACFRKW